MHNKQGFSTWVAGDLDRIFHTYNYLFIILNMITYNLGEITMLPSGSQTGICSFILIAENGDCPILYSLRSTGYMHSQGNITQRGKRLRS